MLIGNKVMKNISLVLSVLLLSLIVLQAGNVLASEKNSDTLNSSMNGVMPKNVEVRNNNYSIDKAYFKLAESDISKFRSENEIEIDMNSMETQNVKLTNDETIINIGFKLKGANVTDGSFYLFTFDKNKKLVNRMLIMATKQNDGSKIATSMVNGTFKNQITGITDKSEGIFHLYSNSKWVADKKEKKSIKQWASCMNDCLAGAGWASWATTLVLGACAGACVVTGGAACLACAAGLGFIAGGTFGACNARCL